MLSGLSVVTISQCRQLSILLCTSTAHNFLCPLCSRKQRGEQQTPHAQAVNPKGILCFSLSSAPPSSVFFFGGGLFMANPQQTEVPRLGLESELQLPTYTTATAMLDLSHVCNLHHSSWQHWIFNTLSEARD